MVSYYLPLLCELQLQQLVKAVHRKIIIFGIQLPLLHGCAVYSISKKGSWTPRRFWLLASFIQKVSLV